MSQRFEMTGMLYEMDLTVEQTRALVRKVGEILGRGSKPTLREWKVYVRGLMNLHSTVRMNLSINDDSSITINLAFYKEEEGPTVQEIREHLDHYRDVLIHVLTPKT